MAESSDRTSNGEPCLERGDFARIVAKAERAEELLASTMAQCERLRKRAEGIEVENAELKARVEVLERECEVACKQRQGAVLDATRSRERANNWREEKVAVQDALAVARDQVKSLRAEVARLRPVYEEAVKVCNLGGDHPSTMYRPCAAVEKAEGEIEKWKIASGLERGGDPEAITPQDAHGHWDAVLRASQVMMAEVSLLLLDVPRLRETRKSLAEAHDRLAGLVGDER